MKFIEPFQIPHVKTIRAVIFFCLAILLFVICSCRGRQGVKTDKDVHFKNNQTDLSGKPEGRKNIELLIEGNPKKIIFNTLPRVEYDIVTNNPYDQFDFPVNHQNAFFFKVYKVPQELVTPELRAFLIAPEDMEKFADYPIRYIETTTTIFQEAKKFIALGYNIVSYPDEHDPPIGNRGTAFIFDSTGAIIRKFDHLDVEIWSPVVTDDGKYFAFKYGQMFVDGFRLLNEGFRIYSVETGELLFEETCSKDERLTLLSCVNSSLIITSKKKRGSPKTTIIAIPSQGQYYISKNEKPLSSLSEKWRNLTFYQFSDTGIYYKNELGELIFVKYDEVYEKKTF